MGRPCNVDSMERQSYPSNIYAPLEDSDEVRLLSLQPRSRGNSIRCTIFHAKLSQKPQFEALSYMWGPSNTKTMQLSGTTFEVRINLWNALEHLRLAGESRTLWIDAICINQHDLSERSHQVTQMGKIFMNATRVVVWLGLAENSSSKAITFLAKKSMNIQSMQIYCQEIRVLSTTHDGYSTLSAIQALCLREYWDRLWIIQEVALASEIIVQCGTETFPWVYLAHLFKMVWEIVDRGRKISGLKGRMVLSNLVGGGENLVRTLEHCTLARLISDRDLLITERSKWGKTDIEHPLLKICTEFGDAKCEDQRDKIIGLRQIASKCCQEAVPVDYTLAMAQISGMVVRHHVLEHAHLSSGAIGDSRQFYQKLGITRKTYGFPSDGLRPVVLYPDTLSIAKSRLITINAHIRGRISFVSSCLGGKISKGKLEVPNMSYILRSNLREISDDRAKCRPVTRQLDLILRPATTMTKCTCTLHDLPPRIPAYMTDIGLVGEDPLKKHFKRVLLNAERIVKEAAIKGCKLAFESGGLIFLAPEEAQIDDLVCQFPGSDTLFLVRQESNSRTEIIIIGRGVGINPSTPSEPCETKSGQEKLHNKQFRSTFQVDLPTLRMMTIASDTPDPDQTGKLPPWNSSPIPVKKPSSWSNIKKMVTKFGARPITV